VAYEEPKESERRNFGRKKVYGKKIKLKSLFKKIHIFEIIDSLVYVKKISASNVKRVTCFGDRLE